MAAALSCHIGSSASGDDPRHGETSSNPPPCLPEDIWCHIHSLMPMPAAARAACLSRAFLRSWRCRPNLTLDLTTLVLKAPPKKIIDRILRNHSGGLKTLRLDLDDDDDGTFPYVDGWLQVAVTPGIEELSLWLLEDYSFPCSLLSGGVGNTIRDLRLDTCVFRPTSGELGPLRRLTNVELHRVQVTGVELECLLSNSLALKQLELGNCTGIIFLKIPSVLQLLSRLTVFGCGMDVIDCKAPNLSFFSYSGKKIKLSLGQQLQMKKFCVDYLDMINELPSIMPNLETIRIGSDTEVGNTPMLLTKFLCLKHIGIQISKSAASSPSYDYLSLVSFIDASSFLETLSLYIHVPLGHIEHESVFGGSSHLRQLPEHRHKCLKSVKIIGLSSAKTLVELTCCILKNAVSLQCLTLDTLDGRTFGRCFGKAHKTCWPPISNDVLKEAFKAVRAIRMYIEDKVAPTVKLTVLEPCTRCHSIPVDDK